MQATCLGNGVFCFFCGERTFSTAPHGDSDGLTTVKFLQVSPLKVEEFSAKMFLEAVGGWSDWPLAFFVGVIYPLENEQYGSPPECSFKANFMQFSKLI